MIVELTLGTLILFAQQAPQQPDCAVYTEGFAELPAGTTGTAFGQTFMGCRDAHVVSLNMKLYWCVASVDLFPCFPRVLWGDPVFCSVSKRGTEEFTTLWCPSFDKYEKWVIPDVPDAMYMIETDYFAWWQAGPDARFLRAEEGVVQSNVFIPGP
jgi:hypothetical protein